MTKFEYLSVMSQTDTVGSDCWVEGANSEDFPHGHTWTDESDMWRELGQAGWELVNVTTTIHPLSQDNPTVNSSETIRYFKRSQ